MSIDYGSIGSGFTGNGSMESTSSVTPLVSINAVAFDTETTGLDTSRARVIQLGAVKIIMGRIDESQTFDQLINPGVPIPVASTEIHGIDDETVA